MTPPPVGRMVRCAKCEGEGARVDWSKGMQPATWMLFDLWKCNACLGYGKAALSQYERAPFDVDTSRVADVVIKCTDQEAA